MFTSKDVAVYNLPNSLEKLDHIGDVYFPQLGALLLKANELIYTIYGIQPLNQFKVSETPINTKSKREGVEFVAKKNEANQAVVGLRAKGTPSRLLKSNGSPCDRHFALLGFSIGDDGDSPKLLVGFEPYILKYHQQCRDEFADCIAALNLEANLELGGYRFSHKATSLSELMQRPKPLVVSNPVSGIEPTMTDLAALVISYVGMFPLLDVFTTLSNDVAPHITDYATRFQIGFRQRARTTSSISMWSRSRKIMVMCQKHSSEVSLSRSYCASSQPCIRPGSNQPEANTAWS